MEPVRFRPSGLKAALAAAQASACRVRPKERWSMDFVQDRLQSGRRFRILTIVDDYTREWKATVVDTSIGGVRMVRLVEELRETTGLPTAIVSDNGPVAPGPSDPALLCS